MIIGKVSFIKLSVSSRWVLGMCGCLCCVVRKYRYDVVSVLVVSVVISYGVIGWLYSDVIGFMVMKVLVLCSCYLGCWLEVSIISVLFLVFEVGGSMCRMLMWLGCFFVVVCLIMLLVVRGCLF